MSLSQDKNCRKKLIGKPIRAGFTRILKRIYADLFKYINVNPLVICENHILFFIMKKLFVTILVIFSLFYSNRPALANMKSADYELQMPNLNFSAGVGLSSGDFKLGFTGGQNMPGPYTSAGFKVLAGFWYIKTIIPFTFSISNQVIDFGSLNTGIGQTASTTLTVSAGGAGGYQVTAQENHELKVDSLGALLPDTTGDSGDITESNAGIWSQNTTFGFGYTMHGNDVPTPFPTAAPPGNQYKQFADISKNESPEVIMSSVNVGKNRISTLTYKINISASQISGRYHNVIIYIATPTY